MSVGFDNNAWRIVEVKCARQESRSSRISLERATEGFPYWHILRVSAEMGKALTHYAGRVHQRPGKTQTSVRRRGVSICPEA
jgi:hypothetical protein